MDLNELKSLLHAGISDAVVEVEGEGSHFNILVVSDVFEGLRPVKKQQVVYALINDRIADGSMHAVNMQLFTKKEWAAKNA